MINVISAQAFVYVIALSVLSGLGSYLQLVREGDLAASLFNAITEIVLAVLVGLIVSIICYGNNWDEWVTYSAVLILTNNAASTINVFRKYYIARISGIFNKKGS